MSRALLFSIAFVFVATCVILTIGGCASQEAYVQTESDLGKCSDDRTWHATKSGLGYCKS